MRQAAHRLVIAGLAFLLLQVQVSLAQRPAKSRIQFLGAAGQVSGSMHLLTAPNGRRLLLDCGMFQGRRANVARNHRIPPQATRADAVLLTHSHLDHIGNLPTLVRKGFEGKVHCTTATAELCRALLLDSARIQERTKKWHGKGKRGGIPGKVRSEPLYSVADAEAALLRLEPHPYGAKFEPVPGVKACFIDAGHVLGSASVMLDVKTGGGMRRIAFSGDIGRSNTLLLNNPAPPLRPDYVVMESTYGNRRRAPGTRMKEQLFQAIKETSTRNGKVVIPSFSLQRTQEVLHLLKQLSVEGRLGVPVYVDSPLSTTVTEIFRRHHGNLNRATRGHARAHGDAFTFPKLRLISSVEESKALKQLEGPAVIISSAGMCNAGRILHHLKNTIEDPRNTIAIVGHQAEGTLGSRLVARSPSVKIHGEEKRLLADVRVLDAFSGHADQGELMGWARACGTQVKRFFVVHGDPGQSEGLARGLRSMGSAVTVPTDGQTVDLD